MGEIQDKIIRFLFNTTYDHKGFAKISLCMARRMAQGDKDFLVSTMELAHVIFDNCISARKIVFIPKTFKYLLGAMALFTGLASIFFQIMINNICEPIQFWTLYFR